MNRYSVNASVTFPAWVYVEAETPDDALQEAQTYQPGDFDYDASAGEVSFNVAPVVDDA